MGTVKATRWAPSRIILRVSSQVSAGQGKVKPGKKGGRGQQVDSSAK